MYSRPALSSEYKRPAGSAVSSMLCCSLPCRRWEWRELRHNWMSLILTVACQDGSAVWCWIIENYFTHADCGIPSALAMEIRLSYTQHSEYVARKWRACQTCIAYNSASCLSWWVSCLMLHHWELVHTCRLSQPTTLSWFVHMNRNIVTVSMA